MTRLLAALVAFLHRFAEDAQARADRESLRRFDHMREALRR